MDPITFLTSFIGGALGQQVGKRYLGYVIDHVIENYTSADKKRTIMPQVLESIFCITSQQAHQYFSMLQSKDNDKRLKVFQALKRAGFRLPLSLPGITDTLDDVLISLAIDSCTKSDNLGEISSKSRNTFYPNHNPRSIPPPITYKGRDSHPICLKIFKDNDEDGGGDGGG